MLLTKNIPLFKRMIFHKIIIQLTWMNYLGIINKLIQENRARSLNIIPPIIFIPSLFPLFYSIICFHCCFWLLRLWTNRFELSFLNYDTFLLFHLFGYSFRYSPSKIFHPNEKNIIGLIYLPLLLHNYKSLPFSAHFSPRFTLSCLFPFQLLLS